MILSLKPPPSPDKVFLSAGAAGADPNAGAADGGSADDVSDVEFEEVEEDKK